jgi:hypothetical protein
MSRDATRTVIVALAGFSFAGLIGITVLDSTNRKNFRYTVFYLLISFLCYLLAINLQDYKFLLSREQMSNLLIDTATLSLICSVVSVVFLAGYDLPFKITVLTIALTGWMIDHIIRTIYTWGDFKKIRQEVRARERQSTSRPASGGCL